MSLMPHIKKPGRYGQKRAFTLPEVIISFCVMAMVITSAVSILAVVLRTNADNVSSLVANGLAQEGIEALRFVRDSDVLLGLSFNGSIPNSSEQVWGAKLFEAQTGGPKYFDLVLPENVDRTCAQANLVRCLPVELKELPGDDLEALAASPDTLVDNNFHRIIRVEPGKSAFSNGAFDELHVNSLVFWQDNIGMTRKVVLTTDLTAWR